MSLTFNVKLKFHLQQMNKCEASYEIQKKTPFNDFFTKRVSVWNENISSPKKKNIVPTNINAIKLSWLNIYINSIIFLVQDTLL